uniref:Mechanosensitive ion channel protein 2ic-like n=1 Tax=Rhizophora mucronata TaxID=61149 RepID=A0A2P2M4V8_RHIMU
MCSMLDPVILPSEASQAVKQRVLKFIRLSSFTLAFAYCLSRCVYIFGTTI